MKSIIVVFAIVLIITLIVSLYMVYLDKKGDKCVIKLPSNCLMEPPSSIDLIYGLRKMTKTRKKKIYLDLAEVERFNFEAYIVIMAQAEKSLESDKKVYLWARSPLSRQVRKTLMTPSSNSSTYHQHLTGDKSVFIRMSELSIPVLDKVEKDLRKIGVRDYFDLNTMITEIIANALEHGIKGRNNFISDFVLTTNGVTLRLINNEYVLENHPDFAGTYYSWTVKKENFTLWRTSII